MRTILLISYYFPPQNFIGAHRPFRFVRYLPKFGWKPIVVTSSGPEKFRSDSSLLDFLPKSVKVIRVASGTETGVFGDVPRTGISRVIRKVVREVSNWFFFPDRKVSWSFKVASMLPELVRMFRPDVVFITAPPFSAFISGLTADRLGIPWIADFRDAWSPDVLELYTPLHRKLAELLEKKVIKSARFVTAVNQRIIKYQRRLSTADNFQLLPNGYDPELIRYGEPSPKTFRISYIGNLVGKRSPNPLFSCVAEFLKSNPHAAKNFEIVFVGKSSHDIVGIAAEYRLGIAVKHLSFRTYAEASQVGTSSSVLWMLVSDRERSAKLITPGKLFDYIGFMRPILAHAPRGAVWDVIQEIGDSVAVENGDLWGCVKALEMFHKNFLKGKLAVNMESRRRFEIVRIVDKLARLLESV